MSDQKFIKKVIKKISREFYGVVDYNLLDTGEVELLDKADRVIALIEEQRLTEYFNVVESEHSIGA